MFYSHEVLTSRKYGVATVWLVATLGSKSSLKRINRKQILDVDVAKACQTIVDPIAPMALRLQGNLLYGVSRVYLQQCGYVLSDAENAHNAMRMMLRTVKNLALDPDAGKARPDQLVLQDDPSFVPEFALPSPDFLADLGLDINFNIARSGESQSLTPFGSQFSSQASALGGLVLPDDSSPQQIQNVGLLGEDGQAASSGFLGAGNEDDPGFTFDDDGNFIDGPSPNVPAGTPAEGVGMLSDAGASARVRREHEDGRIGGAQLPGDHMDLDLPILGDDLPEGEAFPVAGQQQSSELSEIIQSTSTASAPMRRKRRTARVLPADLEIELRNRDLAEWNADYLKNMEAAVHVRKQTRVAQQAKKNAEQYVWGGGVGGIANQFVGSMILNPFNMFIGDKLFERVVGVTRKKVAGVKHDRDSGIDDATQGESRRVRQRTGEPSDELGRATDDNGFFPPGGDEVELPREAVTALDDEQIFSAMPWNMSASIRGSSALPRSGRVGLPDLSRPGSRLVSASPLLGRGQPLRIEPLKSLESDGDMGFGGDEYAVAGPSSPPTVVGATDHRSIRVQEALSAEGSNFLDFVTDAIVEKRNRVRSGLESMSDILQAEAAASIDEITFEELLPTAENNKMIACQGLMMVLTLGSRGMLDVQQPEGFGDINLKLTESARASQVVEISDGEESETEESVAEGHADQEDQENEGLEEEAE